MVRVYYTLEGDNSLRRIILSKQFMYHVSVPYIDVGYIGANVNSKSTDSVQKKRSNSFDVVSLLNDS